MKHTEADAPDQSAHDVEALMSQAQIFASTWSLAGGRFDSGDGFEQAENAKNELRRMLNAALAAQPAAQGDAKDAERLDSLIQNNWRVEKCNGMYRVYSDIAGADEPHAEWRAIVLEHSLTGREAIDAAILASKGA